MWRKGTKFGKKLGRRIRSAFSERKNLLLDVALICLIGVAAFVAFTLIPPSPPQKTAQSYIPQITVGLTVWANYPNGTKIPGSVRSMPNDLILDAFNKLLEDVLVTGDSFSLLTTGGLALYVFNVESASGTFSCAASSSISCGVEFEIGTGGTSVTRTDSGMTTGYTPGGGMLAFPDTAENPSPTTTPNTAACNIGGATDYVYGISGSQVITSSVTINEIGLFARGSAYSGQASSMMWFHDGVSPGISVVSGDTVTVNYQINLNNPGFTNNFCYLIASMFTGNIAVNGADAFSLEATDGTTNTFYNWCGNNNVANQVATPFSTSNTCTTHTGQGKMEIGKGTTPFTPATYALGSILGSASAISSRAYSSPQNFYTTTFTISGSNSITEACEGIVLSAKFYCMFGLTFTGQPQTSGVPFGFTLRTGD